VKVAEKSNGIVAIPKLLTMLAIDRAIVTIDAMGCQREIAQTILDKRADYVLALKDNQGALREDVAVFVAEQKAKDFADAKVTRDTTIDADHGRIETRATTVLHNVGGLQDRHAWPGLQAIVVVDSRREINAKTEDDTRFYLTSLAMDAGRLGPVVGSDWGIENSLCWVMDMTFRDDECRVRTNHAPANFTTLKHMAHNLLRTAVGKDAMRLRRKVAAWDDDVLVGLIARKGAHPISLGLGENRSHAVSRHANGRGGALDHYGRLAGNFGRTGGSCRDGQRHLDYPLG